MNSSLKTRLITSLIGVPLLILVLLGPELLVKCVITVASLIGLYEFFNAVGLKQHKLLCVIGYIASIFISIGFEIATPYLSLCIFGFLLLVFLVWIFSNRSFSVNKIGLLIFALIYVPYFMSNIISIRSAEYGKFLIWLVFIGAFMTDTAAYFVGSSIGKHKLCPDISPKKTIEGAIGGLLGGGASFVIFGLIMNTCFALYFDGKTFNLVLMFVLGIVCAFVSEIGDLVASAVKREYEIKDYGNIFPGHGGMLDRCDSILLVAPTIYLFVSNINMFM